ncbi:MAG: putative amidase [Acidimicrobiales bacterium]|jgi:aspartyl-tRNA(Asn)/glutamyl-tRNA(Gln) amidotransferase subunit A|nr:putative amidase [Acidimicrobiales bacterium]
MDDVIAVAEAVRSGQRSAVDVLDECLTGLDAANPALNAFVVVDEGLARKAAEAVDAAMARGEDPGPLAGVPFGVKDLEDCAGLPTSHGSLLYQDRPPVAEDSVHVARLRAAGGVPVGKCAAPEFGSTCMTATKAWGVTRNPWDVSRTPGGSSGGSAAAVAAGIVPFATASDGGGSTRIPGAFCGLPGFKPSYGRIPHPGAQESNTSVFGAMVTTVADAARHLDVAAGPDDRDRTSLPPPGVRYESLIETLAVSGLRAAWSADLGFAVVDPEVEAIAFGAAEALVDAAGLDLVEREVSIANAMRLWWGAGAVDLWMDLEKDMWPARADEIMGWNRASFERMDGYTVEQFARVWKRRAALEQQAHAIFQDVDVVLTPATAVPAFAAEGPLPTEIDGRDARHSGPTPFTMLANLCWNPAVSLPAGLSAGGLPVGLQIVGPRHRDDIVLRLSRIFEQARPWPRLAPGYS